MNQHQGRSLGRPRMNLPGNSKLLPYQVAEIRTAYANLTTKKAPNGFTQNLCTTYGVSRTVIHKIIKGKYYRES